MTQSPTILRNLKLDQGSNHQPEPGRFHDDSALFGHAQYDLPAKIAKAFSTGTGAIFR
jgi:hypothetical protein